MSKVIHTTFQLKRGNAADWATVNPILAAGEPGFELDTGVLKIGNGIQHYNDLDPISGGAEVQVDDLTIVSINDTIGLKGYTDAQPGMIPVKTANNGLAWINADISGLEYIVLDVGEDLPSPSLNTMHKIYLKPIISPTAGNYYEEYITLEKGTATKTYSWELLGTTEIDLTGYLTVNASVAGVAFGDDKLITAAELQTALGLGDLAYADSATGTVEFVDDVVSEISTGAAGTYNVSATTVDVPATFEQVQLTPEGDVSVEYATEPTVSYDKVNGVTISASSTLSNDAAEYTPGGTITLPSITNTATTTNTDVAVVSNAGTAYTLVGGSVNKAADTTNKFVKKGMMMSVDESNEELIIRYVSNTDTEFYGDAVTQAGAVTYQGPTLSGALPTFTSASVVQANGVNVSAAYASTATFTGNTTYFTATASTVSSAATVNAGTLSAAFTGSTATFTPSVATTVSVAGTNGSITVPAETIDLSVNKRVKTVTVY